MILFIILLKFVRKISQISWSIWNKSIIFCYKINHNSKKESQHTCLYGFRSYAVIKIHLYIYLFINELNNLIKLKL